MLHKDKVVLRNVVIAVVAGSLGAVAIGTSCLGSHPLAVPNEQATSTTNPGTTADNAGGVEPVSTTNITSTTIVVNPASQPQSTSQPETNQTQPASTTIVTQAPASPPTVRVATPQSAPPAPAAAETPEVQAAPPPEPSAAPVPPAAPIIIPIPAPPPTETPSSGNVPSNPGIGSPVQPLPGATRANNFGQTRLPQGQLPVPTPPQGAPLPAPTTP